MWQRLVCVLLRTQEMFLLKSALTDKWTFVGEFWCFLCWPDFIAGYSTLPCVPCSIRGIGHC